MYYDVGELPVATSERTSQNDRIVIVLTKTNIWSSATEWSLTSRQTDWLTVIRNVILVHLFCCLLLLGLLFIPEDGGDVVLGNIGLSA
jgi:ethanolamine transporter EutH